MAALFSRQRSTVSLRSGTSTDNFAKCSNVRSPMTNDDIITVSMPFVFGQQSISNVNAGWKGEVVWAFISYMLYTRGIVDTPCHEILNEVPDKSGNAPESSDRFAGLKGKERKMFESLHSLASGIEIAVKVHSIKTVTVLFGPSSNIPVERYTIEFMGCEADDIDKAAEQTRLVVPTAQQMAIAKRRVVQALVEHNADPAFPCAPRHCVFVAMEVANAGVGADGDSGGMLEGVGYSTEGSALYSTFTFRDSVRWASSQCNRTKVKRTLRVLPKATTVEQHTSDGPAGDAGQSGCEGGCESDTSGTAAAQGGTVWLVSKTGLKAMRR